MQTPTQPPTLLERLLLACVYLFTGAIGASVIFMPTHLAVTNQLTSALSLVWAVFIMSSLIAIPAVMYGRYLIEYTLLPFFGTALAVACLAVWFHVGVDPHAFGRVSNGTALLFALTLRWYQLNRLVSAPGRLPGRRNRWTRN